MNREDRAGQKLTIAHFMPWSGVGGVEIATLRMVEATNDRFRHVVFCLDDASSLMDSFEKARGRNGNICSLSPVCDMGSDFTKSRVP